MAIVSLEFINGVFYCKCRMTSKVMFAGMFTVSCTGQTENIGKQLNATGMP